MTGKKRIRSFKDLDVWVKSMTLAETVYRLSSRLPKEESFGLARELRRSAVSIPSNIAEGHERNGLPDYLRHLTIAQGSLGELETQLILATRLKMIEGDVAADSLEQVAEVGRMLEGLRRSLDKIRRAPELEPRT